MNSITRPDRSLWLWGIGCIHSSRRPGFSNNLVLTIIQEKIWPRLWPLKKSYLIFLVENNLLRLFCGERILSRKNIIKGIAMSNVTKTGMRVQPPNKSLEL